MNKLRTACYKYGFDSGIYWSKNGLKFEAGYGAWAMACYNTSYNTNCTFIPMSWEGWKDSFQKGAYQWCSNVQILSEDDYSKQQQAVKLGYKTVINLYTSEGIVEMVTTRELKEDKDIVKKIYRLFRSKHLSKKKTMYFPISAYHTSLTLLKGERIYVDSLGESYYYQSLPNKIYLPSITFKEINPFVSNITWDYDEFKGVRLHKLPYKYVNYIAYNFGFDDMPKINSFNLKLEMSRVWQYDFKSIGKPDIEGYINNYNGGNGPYGCKNEYKSEYHKSLKNLIGERIYTDSNGYSYYYPELIKPKKVYLPRISFKYIKPIISNMTWDFKQFKGYKLHELPKNYVNWIAYNYYFNDIELKEEMSRVWSYDFKSIGKPDTEGKINNYNGEINYNYFSNKLI